MLGMSRSITYFGIGPPVSTLKVQGPCSEERF
jgi:hypothetical protein